ncbi:unnamed protein product [Urochloa humidicola]
MAEKMLKQQAAPPLLSVSVEKKKKQARVAPPPFPSAWLVSLWAFFNTGIIAAAFAMDFLFSSYNAYSKLPSWLMQHVELTEAADAMASAVVLGHIWCGALQAAAATAALLLVGHHRRRRIRRALAYAALAATVSGHCMYASFVGITVAADPGYLYNSIGGTATVIVFAAGDFLGFLTLIRGGD